jgi:dienelactone hydrolase
MQSTVRNTGERQVRVPAGPVALDGTLNLPAMAHGLVVFAHGSGSSRFSPRNRFVASALQQASLGTLLMDLLTRDEEAVDERTRHLRFDIGLLAERLVHATDWLRRNPDTHTLPVGYFGASTGGGAALVAAAERPDGVGAVVSRGGRPDLAGEALERVVAPTLLIVGGEDHHVLELNRRALGRISAEKRLEVVAGATHLFEEPGALDQVARLAADWFTRQLSR